MDLVSVLLAQRGADSPINQWLDQNSLVLGAIFLVLGGVLAFHLVTVTPARRGTLIASVLLAGKMKTHINLLLGALAVACCSCDSTPDTLIQGGYDEQEMEAAIARARSEVDSFIVELEQGNGTDFSVKAPIEDRGETEHFWLTDIVYRNGEFEGLIGNDPGMVTNVKIGQQWTIKKSDISDWMFMRDGKIHGNYTMRPLLRTMPVEEAERFRSMLADP